MGLFGQQGRDGPQQSSWASKKVDIRLIYEHNDYDVIILLTRRAKDVIREARISAAARLQVNLSPQRVRDRNPIFVWLFWTLSAKRSKDSRVCERFCGDRVESGAQQQLS